MKRLVAMIALVLFALSSVWVSDGWARAGGGGSGGSRGSRSFSAPVRPSPGQISPSRPAAPQSPMAPAPVPQRPGWGGMLGGLLVGGLLGGLLFGGLGGHGLFGGVGLLEIVVIGGMILFAISWMRRRQVESPGPAYAGGYGGGGWTPAERSMPAATLEAPPEPSDLDRGLGHIRQMDGGFDAAAFAEMASDMFFKIQAAWTGRDIARVADLLTPEMQGLLQAQCDRLRAERRINRLENIAVRQAEVTEAWQEKGQDYVTVHFLASLLDYTTDESGRVVEGSTTDPVKFEEYWTFVRPVGPNRFKLSAIQQAA
jgi:predicted lipid-binding transport protein (Tim44 family)